MLKAIILDFDGVVVDTETAWFTIIKKWLKQRHDYDLGAEEYISCVGSNSNDLFAKLKEEKGIVVDRELFAKETTKMFIEETKFLPALPGVIDFIHAVKNSDLGLALATSAGKEKPNYHLKRLNLLQYFDYLVTAEDVPRIKPFPDLFLKAADLLERTADEVLVVEDSINGKLAADAAGMRSLIIPNAVTRFCDFKPCYMQLDSLSELDLASMVKNF